jgi:hypothetical protein
MKLYYVVIFFLLMAMFASCKSENSRFEYDDITKEKIKVIQQYINDNLSMNSDEIFYKYYYRFKPNQKEIISERVKKDIESIKKLISKRIAFFKSGISFKITKYDQDFPEINDVYEITANYSSIIIHINEENEILTIPLYKGDIIIGWH